MTKTIIAMLAGAFTSAMWIAPSPYWKPLMVTAMTLTAIARSIK